MLSILNNDNKMRVEATIGITRVLIPKNEIDANETIFSRALKQNDFIVFDNPADEPDYNEPFDSIFHSGPCIAKAIKARGKVIAVLILSRGENGESFKDIELDYISTALEQSAFAFDNAELIRELKNSNDELKEMQQKLINQERESVVAINFSSTTSNNAPKSDIFDVITVSSCSADNSDILLPRVSSFSLRVAIRFLNVSVMVFSSEISPGITLLVAS